MRLDYHMHFEYGSYDLEWVKGFFASACAHGIAEIGISEHSHGFCEFRSLYEEDLILDNSKVGQFQTGWLKKNKFKYTLDEYFTFMDSLKKLGYPVKTGIEVCNFQDQRRVAVLLAKYPFDYIIGSVHFVDGWGYDFSDLRSHWETYNLRDLYERYVCEIEALCSAGLYDVLGHPFNIRLFENFPEFDVSALLTRVAEALKAADMAVDVNTGTLYRYPVREISPYPAFMEVAAKFGLPIITSSDAHQPEDCGRYIDEAVAYAQQFGYEGALSFNNRKRSLRLFSE